MSLLIVHRNDYLTEELEAWAIGMVPAHFLPARVCHDMETARTALAAAEPPDMLVVESDLPGGGPHAGLTLTTEMRARWTDGRPVPVLLVAAAADHALRQAALELPVCSLIHTSGDLERDYQYALRCLVNEVEGKATPLTERPPCYYINVQVDASGNCGYQVRSVRTAVDLNSNVRFSVEPARLKNLLARMPTISDGVQPSLKEWIDTYRSVGEELTRALFREHAEVLEEFTVMKGVTLASPGIRVGLCFSVDRSFYRLPFEALQFPARGISKYWMESAPLWRRLPEFSFSGQRLFAESSVPNAPLNCLLINARCGGAADMPNPIPGGTGRLHRTLDPLVHADKEIDSITTSIVQAIPRRVGRLVSISMDQGVVRTVTYHHDAKRIEATHAGHFEAVLERLLTQEGPWDLVHFTGHSHFEGTEEDGFGYVFVPRKAATRGAMPSPHAVGINKMAAWLNGVRFVFLSGCSSSHRDFVVQLCARNVPALSGYPWPVMENVAWEHSAHFYRRLLDSCSIEEALQKSWMDMYADHQENWAWASSQFVIQG
ncbi:CHAT domain-containing protein [Roseateles sp. YR242]|uniref:CHAT domain-containing protein n=1 Tax=Roseateles sp. YR242 TaxID=1855305 RepID=UPI0008D72776|nr:CHAT domain-containing protein [Roseateles sp. YR242]SEL89381.1 CHAT domain-containing protein [Roseateles sp. YR242]